MRTLEYVSKYSLTSSICQVATENVEPSLSVNPYRSEAWDTCQCGVMPRANLDGLEQGADSEAILEKSLADHNFSNKRARMSNLYEGSIGLMASLSS